MNFEINNKKEPFDDFLRIANELMNDHVLIVDENYYRLTSLEFYYFDEDNHPDIYSHQHILQKTNGKWYFHGSGLDITFGGEETYGGILIRGIKHLQDKRYINGPLVCVQELFNHLGKVDESRNFAITRVPWDRMGSLVEEQKVFWAKRVNLNVDKDKSDDLRFHSSFYRFFINPKETQKDKTAIAEDLLHQGLSKSEINELFGYKHLKL